MPDKRKTPTRRKVTKRKPSVPSVALSPEHSGAQDMEVIRPWGAYDPGSAYARDEPRSVSALGGAQNRPESFGGHVCAWVAEEAHYMPFGKRLIRSLLGGVADWGPVRSYLDHLYPEHCRNCGAQNADELVSRRVLNRRSSYMRGVSGRQRTTRELWEYRYRCQACGHMRREERTAAYRALINPR